MDLDKYLQQAGMASPPPTPVVPGMKMEFPGPPPGYGHGFGPPVILDLSPRNVVDQSLPYSPGTKKNQSLVFFLELYGGLEKKNKRLSLFGVLIRSRFTLTP